MVHQQGNGPNPPVANDEPTPRDGSARIINCPMCRKKIGRMFRRKKTCLRCGKFTCGKCFNGCCGHIGSNMGKKKLNGAVVVA